MKPLEKVEITLEGMGMTDLTVHQHREMISDIVNQNDGIMRLKDGTVIKATITGGGDIKIEKIEPWYEFDDENELKKYLTTDKEEFENFVRWQKLKNILDEE